jgi:hypothetical protein
MLCLLGFGVAFWVWVLWSWWKQKGVASWQKKKVL